MNIKQTQVVVSKALTAKLTPIVWGRHGIGKSQVIAQLAQAKAKEQAIQFTRNPNEFDDKHYGFVDLRLGQTEVGDLIGLPDKVDENGSKKTIWLKPEWFPSHPKSRGIIFLDELNRARLDVLQAVFQLVWDRRLATHVLPEGWGLVVACNPAGADYFVNEIDPALMDRFVHIKLNPETKEWVEWAKNSNHVMSGITDFIEKYPDMLGTGGVECNIDVKPSPRSWEVLSYMLDGLDQELWLETSMGIIGNEASIPFLDSLKKNIEKPVQATQIFDQYDKWKSRVKKQSDPEKSRIDLLRLSCDDIERIIKKDYISKDLTKAQEKNLIDFMGDIPADLCFSLVKFFTTDKSLGTNKFMTMLNKYPELYTRLKDVSKL
jgi:hypothetical protein